MAMDANNFSVADCMYRGEVIYELPAEIGCCEGEKVQVRECSLHHQCVRQPYREGRIPQAICQFCLDRRVRIRPEKTLKELCDGN